MAKRKDRKDRKKKKGAKRAAKRGLPSAVKGLLQYLGGSDASLQPSAAPQRPRATGADAGETLTRYLAAKTENLEAMRRAAMGTTTAQQIEERALAKRAAEDVEKKVSMLSAGLKESDKEKKKVIKELREQKTVLQGLGNQDLFADIQRQKIFSLSQARKMGMQTPSVSSAGTNTPWWAGLEQYVEQSRSQREDYGMQSDVASRSEDFEGGNFYGSFAPVGAGEDVSARDIVSGGGAAAEMYMMNRPLERPIIRDKPRKESAVRLPPRVKSEAPASKRVQISAGDLREGIRSATGMARSRYKLPSRQRYADVQAALGRTAGSSADLIGALKEAGINFEQV